jgi:hypothetical protein
METTNVQPQNTEDQKENYRDFISFMDEDIKKLQKRMNLLKHLAFSTLMGCVLAVTLGFWMFVPLAFLLMSIASYVTFRYTGKTRNLCIVVRESTYAEMLEL